MLHMLQIENIAVIEKAEIEFGEGLNVLTGETGAGKSMVIDALNAATGGRTSHDLVRTGAPGAIVTAVFSDDTQSKWFDDNGVGRDDDGQVFILRKISADGKNTCRVNGCPVSVAQLRELGGSLIDIHGQNDGRKLLDESAHIGYLDSYAGLEDELESYKAKYSALREKEREIDDLTMDESEKERRVDTLKYQIGELERADIRIGETAEKEARREILKNSSKLTDAVDSAFCAIYGGEMSDGAAAIIGEAESAAASASRFSEDLGAIAEKLRELRYSALDVAEELRDLRASLDFSPNELDETEERILLLHRLSRKYGGSEDEMIAFMESCRQELDSIEYSADKLVKLQRELESHRADALMTAMELSDKRKSAAKTLETRIMDELSQLNMPSVHFEVEFAQVSGKHGLDSRGCDEVRFLMSANAGEEPGRISRIASGGELSRIMLAMKNVLAENDDLGAMVFDEIDTGVSGIAAQRVGEKLADLAKKRQVLCVTHLPQIAAIADAHFIIEKEQKGDRTFTYVNRLDIDGRKQEIARLTGGENITLTTLSSAAEQLEAADRYKKKKC